VRECAINGEIGASAIIKRGIRAYDKSMIQLVARRVCVCSGTIQLVRWSDMAVFLLIFRRYKGEHQQLVCEQVNGIK
jgi:hypothetical protein